MVFLKTRPFVQHNNAAFMNVYSFISLLVCYTYFTLSCRILLFSFPTSNIFFQFLYSEIPGDSDWRVLFRPPSVLFASLVIGGHHNSTWFYSELMIPRTFQLHAGSSCTALFLFVFSFLYTKNALKRAQFTRYNTNFSTILLFSSELSNN